MKLSFSAARVLRFCDDADSDLVGGQVTHFIFLLRCDGVVLYEPCDNVGLIVIHGLVYQRRAARVLGDRQLLFRFLRYETPRLR